MSSFNMGDKVQLCNDPMIGEISGKRVTLVDKHVRHSTGQSWVVEFENGDQDIIHEGHFEKVIHEN